MPSNGDTGVDPDRRALERARSAALALAAVKRMPVGLAFVDVELDGSGAETLIRSLLEARAELRVTLISPGDDALDLGEDRADRVPGSVGRPLSVERLDRVIELVFGEM